MQSQREVVCTVPGVTRSILPREIGYGLPAHAEIYRKLLSTSSVEAGEYQGREYG